MGRSTAYRFPFAKYPAIRIAILFAGGIVIATYVHINLIYWLEALLFLLIAGVTVTVINRRSARISLSYIAVACYIIGLIVFGAAWQTFHHQNEKPTSAQLLNTYTWQKVTFKGTVQQMDPSSSGNMMLDVAINQTVFNDTLKWNEVYKIRAYGPKQATANIQPGDRITFKATIYPLEKISNPGKFKYKQYLASQEIYMHAGVDTMLSVEKGSRWLSWNWLQQDVRQLIEQNFNDDTRALAKSLLIGYKNELSRETKTAFSRVGLAHIMAVSGMNVVYILAPFWLLIPFLWTMRFGKQIGLALMIFILVLFAGLTGFSASVMRACITGGFITYGRIFNKARNSKNLTAVAAIIILLINPADLFNVGFQLSFAAVYIILLILPEVQRLIPDAIQHRWVGIPIMAAIVTLVVQLGLYPILSYYFHEFSLIAPLANAVVVPFLGLVVPYALLLLPIAFVFPTVSYFLNAPCRWFFEFLQWFTATLSQWSWSWMQTPETGMMLFLIWIAVFMFVASIRIPKMRWKWLIILLILLTVQQSVVIYNRLKPPRLKVTMLDVGQGDAAVITTPNGGHFLVDTGRWSPDYNSGAGVILPYLKHAGIKNLEGVFLSHPHADHIGGMAALIGNIPIQTIYNAGVSYDSDIYHHYLDEADRHHIPVKTLQAGDMLHLGAGVQLFVYGPVQTKYSTEVNNHSLVFELIYGQTQFLFMGDAEKNQEARLVQNYEALLDADFLKVGHHGSKTSSSNALLKIVTPRISAISVAKDNRYGLPDAKAIRRLQKTNTHLYFTALNGALQFVSNGKGIKQVDWR